MKLQKKFGSRLSLLGVVLIAAAFTATTHAQTTWDGGGSPDNSINNKTNWNTDVVNPLDGSTATSFASAGSNAVMNVSGKLKTVTFNRPAGFVIDGPGTLTVSNSIASGSPNVTVSVAQNAGPTVINAPFAVETGTTAAKLLNILNNSLISSGGASLIFSNSINATVSANPFAFRLQGSGTTRFAGAITNCTAIQPAAAAYTGTNIIAGNQILATNGVIACDVQIAAPGTGNSSATARIQMGESTSDIQTWRSASVLQVGTVAINSTATLLGGVGVENNNTLTGTHGGIFEINGSVTATTLGLGSGNTIGTLKLAGPAYFSGNVSSGAAVGTLVLGNAASLTPLTLSGGTIASSVTIGGAGANDNNITLIKTNSGTLSISGTHTYVGPTLVQAGRLDLNGALVSSITVSNAASLGGEGSTTGSLTFGSGTESFYYDPTTGGAFTANTINASGATVIVNPSSSASGVVMQSTTTPNGITGTPGVNFVSGARGNLTLNGAADTLSFTPTSAANLVWKGGAANPSFWDVIITTNWNNGTERFYSSDNVRFDDTASSFNVVVQGTSITPGNTVISNNVSTYTFSGGNIGGVGSVTKSGSGTATISSSGHSFTGGLTVNGGTLNLLSPTANNFSGGITNNGGTLVISNVNQIAATTTTAANGLNLNGGSLSYTGPTFSQTTDTLPLNLLGGVSTIEVTTSNTTLRVGTAVTGSGDLIKSGAGTFALGRNTVQTPLGNTFTGKITVTGGQLDIRQSDSMGATSGITVVTNATLYLDPFGQPSGMTFDAEPLVFSGNSYIRNFNQSTTVSQTDVLTGPITNNGALGIFSQTNGAYGELQISGDIVNGSGSSLNFGSNNANVPLSQNQIVTITGNVTGPASVFAQGGTGATYTLANNNYTGNTTVSSGTLVLQQATLATNSSVTIAATGVLKLDFGAVTNSISTLTLNGVVQSPGAYNAGNASPYLAGAGTLLVTSSPIASYSTNLTTSVSGSTLSISWPTTHLGWILQAQTNSLSVGLAPTWSDISGTASVTSTNLPINPANPSVFFRLRHP